MIHPLKKIELNHLDLYHPRVPAKLDGYTIAQMSDVHMGRWVKPHHIRELVEYFNEQAPDLVVLTGDYVGYDKRDMPRFIGALEQLKPKAYAVLGNHDHWASTSLCQEAFAASPVKLLTNEHVTLEHQGARFELVGVDDVVTKHADVAKAFKGVDPERFALVLNHVPSLGKDCAEAGGHLILSGHTHNFQFNIPQLTNTVAQRFGAQFFAGPYRLSDQSFMYINRGLGSASWPWRVRAMPELSFFRLRRGERMRLELTRHEVFESKTPARERRE